MNDLQKALDSCLDMMANKGLGVEESLEHYPDIANDLRPLLNAAQSLGSLKNIQPDAEYKKKARAELIHHINAPAKSSSTFFGAAGLWHKLRATPALRTATSLAMVLMLFATAGTAFAQRALPGDFLYPWKITTEQVWLNISRNKFTSQSNIIMRRMDELIAVHGDQSLEASSLEAYLFSIRSLDLAASQLNYARTLEALHAQEQALRDAGFTFPELQDLPGLLQDPGIGLDSAPSNNAGEGGRQEPDLDAGPDTPTDDEANQPSLEGATATLVPNTSLP